MVPVRLRQEARHLDHHVKAGEIVWVNERLAQVLIHSNEAEEIPEAEREALKRASGVRTDVEYASAPGVSRPPFRSPARGY